ncbi:MAG: hypothetical protein ACKVRP_04285 [Bacteroidota bacterium]
MKKRLHIIIATTLFAGMLWISVKLGSTYQVVVSTPLKVTGLPAGTALNAPVPQEVQLRLRGEGWQLAGLLFGSEFHSTVDVQSLTPRQTTITVNDVVDRLNIPTGIQAMEMKPDSISVEYDSLGWKKVPVTLDYTTSFSERYGPVGQMIVTPESVLIEGARSILAEIDSWPTVRMQFDDLKAPVDAMAALLESSRYQLAFNPSGVNVRLDVQWYAEKVFAGLPVELLSVPPHREVILVPPRIDLVVRGGVDQLSALSLADFRASLDYIVILSDSSGYLEPEVIAPSGVQIVSTRPDGLRYIVRKRL